MKIKHRFLSAILILSMLFPVVIYAEENDTKLPEYGERVYGKLLFLENMGYFSDMSELALDDGVNREQFAHMLSITANMTDEKAFTETSFYDVPETNAYYDDIQKVISAGYMVGSGIGRFSPSKEITLGEAAVALVRLTGREAYAQSKGGYPAGYEATARNIGIYDGVDGKNNQKNILLMIYNTLTASYLTPVGLGRENTVYQTEDTVAAYFHNVYAIKGVMTANRYTSIYREDYACNNDSVEIDNTAFKTKGDYNDLLGKMVRGFYRYDKENDERTIVSIYAENKDNDVLVVNADGLQLDGDLNLTYEVEENKYDKAALARGFSFIYNNRVVENRQDTDVLITDGQLILINSDGDNKYETVIAREIETMKVSGIGMYNKEIYTDTDVLKLAPYSNAVAIYKRWENGQFVDITIDEIKRDSVITVYRSHDQMYLEVLVSNNTVYAAPTEIDEDYAVIDGIKYEFAKASIRSELALGVKAEFMLDVYDRIAYTGGSNNYNFQYGYMFKVLNDIENEKILLRLITSKGNKLYEVKSKLMIDGVSNCDAEALLALLSRGIIRYKLNSKGEISAVDRLGDSESYDEVTNCLSETVAPSSIMYYPNSKTFYTDGRYTVDSDTFFVMVPSDADEQEDISMYATAYSGYGIDPASYRFALYDADKQDCSLGAYIYFYEGVMKNPSLTDQSPVAVVKKVTTGWYDDEPVKMIWLNDNGEEHTYVIDNSVPSSTVEGLGFGDVVKFELNYKGYIGSLKVEFDADADSPANSKVMVGGDNFYRYDFGRIINTRDAYMVIQTDDTVSKRMVPTTDVLACTLVDMCERQITKIDSNYYSTYISGTNTPSYLYARVYKNFRALDLVIYKY